VGKKHATSSTPVSAKPTNEPTAPIKCGPGAGVKNGRSASEDDIRLRAYQKWEFAGKPIGDGVNFWTEAKQELLQAK
jgi:hypothetical protein